MEKIPETSSEEEYKVEFDRSELLSLAPHELAARFHLLEERGELQGFCKKIVEDDQLLAMASWWERWLSKTQILSIEAAVKDRRRQAPLETMGALPLGLDKKFLEEELQLIFSNLGALQLTHGCSLGCKFCAFDALPRAREHFPFAQVKLFLERFGNMLPKRDSVEGRTLLFYASDPADYTSTYEGERKTFQDVYELFEQRTGEPPYMSTRKINDPHWTEFVKGLNGGKRVSTLGLQQEAAKTVREESGGEHSRWKPIRGIGRDFVKNSEGHGGGGIGCFDGTLITPRGLYNTVQVPVSKRYPQGMIVAPIERLSQAEVVVGDPLDKALRYVIPANIPIHEYGTIHRGEEERIYASGEVEFQVFLNGKKKFIIVDCNFIIQKICDASPLEQKLTRLTTELERAIEDAESSPNLLQDEQFAEKFWKLNNQIDRAEYGGRYILISDRFGRLEKRWEKVIEEVAGVIRRIQKRNKKG